MKRSILLASALMVLAVVLPSSASAWTPKECADWYATHGSNHPDCQWYVPPPPPPDVTVCSSGQTITVPENQVPEGATPGECAPVVPPPPAPPEQPAVPPAPPAPPAQPPVTTTPDTHDVEVVDEAPQADIGTPVTVRGKEESGGGLRQGSPNTVPVETGPTLPFTGAGMSIPATALLGLSLLMAGRLARKRLSH